MNTIFMSFKNIKTSEPARLLLNISDKIKRSDIKSQEEHGRTWENKRKYKWKNIHGKVHIHGKIHVKKYIYIEKYKKVI